MTTTLTDLVERCVCEQAERWRQGERVPIEMYIASHTELAGDDPRMDLLYAEVLLRESEGESVLESEYQARFPDLNERIAALFQFHRRLTPSSASPPPRMAEPDAPLTTPRFAEYSLLGRGGMSTVYRARDLDLNRIVAIKLLHPHVRELGGAARLRKEASAIARLHHPNILQIYDVGEENGQPYLVLEYVAGGTLADRLRRGVLPMLEAVRLLRDVAAGLQSAHDQQVIHRDLKPGNILLEPGPSTGASAECGSPMVPKIADFGLAKQLDDAAMSQSGALVGTAFYMAPEQATTGAIGPPADVYALGAMLYECLTGRPPYLGDSPIAVLALAGKADPVPPSRLRPGIPRDLGAVVLKCLQVEPGRRYHTAKELAEDLDRILTDRPTLARPSTLADRLMKWVRRNPQPAAYAAIAVLTAVIGLSIVLWQWQEAVAAKANLQTSLNAEAEQRRATERSLYATAIAQAAMNWDLGDVAKAHEQLTLALPSPGHDDLRGWEWYYLHRLFHSERLVLPCDQWCNGIVRLPGNDGFVLAIGNPRMNAFETGPGDGRTARLLLAKPELRKGPDIPGAVMAVAVDARSGFTAWATRGGLLAVANSQDEVVARIDTSTNVSSIGFIGDGSRIVIGDDKGKACIFEWASGSLEREITIWPLARALFTVSPDRKFILFGGGLHRAKLYALPDWDFRGELSTKLGAVSSVTINATSTLGATGSIDGTLLLWNLADRVELLRFKAHNGPVAAVAFHPTEPLVASSGSDGAAHLWNQTTGQLIATYRGHTAAVRSLAFSADGQTLITGGQDSTIRLWDCRQNPRGRLLTFRPRLNSVDVQAADAGLTVRAVELGGDLRTWRIAANASAEQRDLALPLTGRRMYPVAYAVFLDKGRRLVGLPRDDARSVAAWDTETGRELERFSTPGEVITLATDDQHRWLAVAAAIDNASCDIQVRLPGAATPAASYRLPEPTVRAIAVSRDGRMLAAVGNRSRTEDARDIWLLRDGHEPKMIGSARRNVGGLAFNHDSQVLAVGNDTRIDLYDCSSGRLLRTTAAVGDSTCLTFSHDGRRIATVGYAGVVALADLTSGKVVFQLRGLTSDRPEDLAADARVLFTPDDRTMISTNWDGSINIWNGPR